MEHFKSQCMHYFAHTTFQWQFKIELDMHFQLRVETHHFH